MVEQACNSAITDGIAHEPESVADALAIDHAVRQRLRAVRARKTSSGAWAD
jgi:1-deoxy-D-xylulose-5-phosphate reductoisomerase